MNYSHYKIFKYIGFIPSHYVSAINLDVELFFSVFGEFDYVCIVNFNQCNFYFKFI